MAPVIVPRWLRTSFCLLVVVAFCPSPCHSFFAGVSSAVVNMKDEHDALLRLSSNNLESSAHSKNRQRRGRARSCRIFTSAKSDSLRALRVDGKDADANANGYEKSKRTGAAAAAAADRAPTVLNPRTRRRIRVGGGKKSKWNELMSEGGWIMHNGVLKRMNSDLLIAETGQQHVAEESEPPQRYDEEEGEENWFPIEPSIAVHEVGRESRGGGDSSPVESVVRGEVLFVHKPPGLLSVPGIGPDKADCLSSRVSSIHPRAKPCHRLDRDTSGVVVFGLSAEAHREISKQFELRSATKTYVALVAGHPSADGGVIDLPIGKRRTSEGFNRWVIGGEKSREARTRWLVRRRFFDVDGGAPLYSRVELTPLTGRGQQLRLHMRSMGHPILGDTIHAPGNVALASPRLCLHAERLEIEFGQMTLVATSVPPF